MKKGFIIFILFNISFSLFASEYFITTTLALESKENLNLLNNDNASTFVDNIKNYEFDDIDINNLTFITKLCNNYLTSMQLNEIFVDNYKQTLYNSQIKDLNDKLTTYTTSYSTNLDKTSLTNIEKTVLSIQNIRETGKVDTFDDILVPKFQQIDSNALIGLLLENNESQIVNNLLSTYSTNAFLIITFPTINNIKRLKIEYVDNQKRDTIYDKILKTQFVSDNTKDILNSLVKYFNKEYSLLTLNNKNQSTKVEEIKNISRERVEKAESKDYQNLYLRSSDLNKLDITKDYIVIKKGIHYLKISNSSTSYIEKIIIGNEENILDLKLKEYIVPSINLISEVGLVNFQLNGNTLNPASSLNLENQRVPFYVDAKKDGFSTFTIQNLSNFENINFSLKPLWMQDSNIISKEQDDFYSSLFSYVLISFASLTINSVNDAVGNDELQPILDILSTSVVSLSSLNIIYKLISYIKIATT